MQVQKPYIDEKVRKHNLPSHKMCTIFCVLFLYIKVLQNIAKIKFIFPHVCIVFYIIFQIY